MGKPPFSDLNLNKPQTQIMPNHVLPPNPMIQRPGILSQGVSLLWLIWQERAHGRVEALRAFPGPGSILARV